MQRASNPYVIDRARLDEANLSKEQRECLMMQDVLLTFSPYYSAIAFCPTRTVVGPTSTYALAAGYKATAFSYGIGDSMAPGGFGGPFAIAQASEADTNLSERSKTNNGESVHIFGIALQWYPGSDPRLIEALFGSVRARLSTEGAGRGYLLGPLHVFGGTHGLSGSPLGQDEPGLTQFQAFRGVYTQSLPQWDNCLQIPEGIVWQPEGSDSNFSIEFETQRPITFSRTARAPIAPSVVDGFQGVTGYDPGEVIAAAHVRLVGSITGPRSKVT